MFNKVVPEYTDRKEAPMIWYDIVLTGEIVSALGALYLALTLWQPDGGYTDFVLIYAVKAVFLAVWSWFFWKRHWWTVCWRLFVDIWEVLVCACTMVDMIATGQDYGMAIFEIIFLAFFARAEWVYFGKRRLLFKPYSTRLAQQQQEGIGAEEALPAFSEETVPMQENADLPAETVPTAVEELLPDEQQEEIPPAPVVRFCRYCGSDIAPDERFCHHCGKRLLAD